MITGLGTGHVWLTKIEIEERNNTSSEHFNFCQKYFTLHKPLFKKKPGKVNTTTKHVLLQSDSPKSWAWGDIYV